MQTLKQQLTEDMKNAMRAQEKARLGVIRLMLAAIKQYEVDERKPAEDPIVLGLLDKMIKQRRESLQIYQSANKTALAAQEQFEIDLIQTYLPQPLSAEEIEAFIRKAITTTQASTLQHLGKVIAELKPQLIGRADMAMVSAKIKQLLSE